MSTPAQVVEQGFARGQEIAQQRSAQEQAQKDQQRAATAGGYLNAVQTELPPSTVKDANGNPIINPAYTLVMQKREDAYRDYLRYLGPEQHATFANRLHGLITGHLSGGQDQATAAAATPTPTAPRFLLPRPQRHPLRRQHLLRNQHTPLPQIQPTRRFRRD